MREAWKELRFGILLAAGLLAVFAILAVAGPPGWAETFVTAVSVVTLALHCLVFAVLVLLSVIEGDESY